MSGAFQQAFQPKDLPMRFTSLLAAAICLMAAPALADDEDYGAYLFKGTCDAWDPGAVVEDVGDLDVEEDVSKEWARMSPDDASAPARSG